MGVVISNMSDAHCFMTRFEIENIAENMVAVKHIKLKIFHLATKCCEMLNASASQKN